MTEDLPEQSDKDSGQREYGEEILGDYEFVIKQLNMSDRLFEVIWSSE